MTHPKTCLGALTENIKTVRKINSVNENNPQPLTRIFTQLAVWLAPRGLRE